MFSILFEACNGNTDASYHKSHVKKEIQYGDTYQQIRAFESIQAKYFHNLFHLQKNQQPIFFSDDIFSLSL